MTDQQQPDQPRGLSPVAHAEQQAAAVQPGPASVVRAGQLDGPPTSAALDALPEVIRPGAFADMVGRRVPIRIGDGNGPLIGVAEVIGPNGETRMTICVDLDDPDDDLGVSLVFSTAQLAYALGREPAQQPHVEASPPRPRPVSTPAPRPAPRLPVPGCPGRPVSRFGDLDVEIERPPCTLPLGHYGGCR